MALLYLSSFSDCGIEGTWGRANPSSICQCLLPKQSSVSVYGKPVGFISDSCR